MESLVFCVFAVRRIFNRFKLEFDWTFWIGEVSKVVQRDIYEVAIASHMAPLYALKPGVTAGCAYGLC